MAAPVMTEMCRDADGCTEPFAWISIGYCPRCQKGSFHTGAALPLCSEHYNDQLNFMLDHAHLNMICLHCSWVGRPADFNIDWIPRP